MSGNSNLPYFCYSCAVPATAIEKCVSGNFTSHDHLNLITAKISLVELFLVGPEGLKLMKQIRIYGAIKIMLLFRPEGEIKDYLFIVTSRYDAMILEAKEENDKLEILTLSYGNMAVAVGKISDKGIIAAIDPDARMIALRIYEGLLQIIQLQLNTDTLRAINVSIEETQIHDLIFLHGFINPTILLLYKDNSGSHIETYEICLKEKQFINIPWNKVDVDMEVSIILPVEEPVCGFIIIGQESILYHGVNFKFASPVDFKFREINCYDKFDSSGYRYILGDITGKLFMLLLEEEEIIDESFSIKDIKVEYLAEVTIPQCITYVDSGVFFVGSKLGDSQLVKLTEGTDSEPCYCITILESFINLAPIVDMVLMDFKNEAHSQLITCSGAFKEGSLRIIRNGISFQEKAIVELPNIKGVWTLNLGTNNSFDNTLVLAFVSRTIVLSINNQEVEEIDIEGFETNCQTILCKTIQQNVILQVTTQFVRLLCLERKQILSEWKPLTMRNINLVAANDRQIVCSSAKDLYYIEICNNLLAETKYLYFDHEISCLDITSFPEDHMPKYVAVGLWNDISARILKLPSLQETHREYFDGEVNSRSILFVTFEDNNYVLCALGDGSVYYFIFDVINGELSEKKRITLGTQPMILRLFKCKGTINVLACSNLPAVIYTSHNKLAFSNVNLKQINYVSSINTNCYQEALAIATDTMLLIGTLDEIQKLDIRSVPLNEAPRRIALQESSKTIGVITARIDVQGPKDLETLRESASTWAQVKSNSEQSLLAVSKKIKPSSPIDTYEEVEVHHFLLFDQETFEVLHSHQMLPYEYGLSILSCKLGTDPNIYYIIGTGIVDPREDEPRLGRIMVFHVDDGRLSMIHEKEIKGACYSLAELNGRLIASINGSVNLYDWEKEKKFLLHCSHSGNILALYVKTKGDFVLVADILRAISLLQYKTMKKSLEEIARDYYPSCMTAIEILDDDTFLGAENSSNIFICHKDSSLTNDEDRMEMQEVAQFHLGDMVNMFRHGALSIHPQGDNSKSAEKVLNNTLFGTVNGSVGVVKQIHSQIFNLLNELQKLLTIKIKSVGMIHHSSWRSFASDLKFGPAEGFIDGDLIECFLDLSRKEMKELVIGIQNSICKGRQGGGNGYTGYSNHEFNHYEQEQVISVDTMIKLVEDITRIY